MGTSKRNLSNEIKKILNKQPLNNINDAAPEVTKKILNLSTLKSKFDQEETLSQSIEIIKSHFSTLTSNGFKGKSKKEILEDPITQQEFLEMILDQIESNTIIESTILEKSLKIVMCKFLELDDFDVYSFAQVLFYEIIFQILLGQLNDNIKDVFEEVDYSSIKLMVKNLADQIVNETIYEKVNMFIDRKISLNQVLSDIANHTSQASFGEF